jgi:hypothetical protein
MAKTKKSPKVKKKSRKDKLALSNRDSSLTAGGGAAGFGLGKVITRKNIRSTERLNSKRAPLLFRAGRPDQTTNLAKEYLDSKKNIAHIRRLKRIPAVLAASGAGLTAAAMYKRKKNKTKGKN